MSRRRSTGRSRRMASSSTPRVAIHRYWSYLRTFCFSSCVLLSLHSSNLTVVDWSEKRTNPKMAMIIAKVISPTRVLVKRFCPRELQCLD
ncbi:hypothetical protein TorRG33x02_024580 [Trema orientale]|uniref:Uncharacterized protein n=1 Tax=Trema orientale TaxID=63057 RepID=A0A2P5FV59_TREOI|nr:hypothetical protein TorRG33x02_024580 [Trema orientale]